MSNVVISAATLENFNHPAGSDLNLTVSVENGSADVAVVGGGALPANLIGIPGATITIAGTNYFIAGATSPTAFTLAANYSGSTDNDAAAILRKWVQLRIYASAPFVPLGESDAVMADPIGSDGFYKRTAASVTNDGTGNVLQLPQITLAGTISGSPGTATYAAIFADASGRRIADYDGFLNFSLADTTPVTWAQIFVANNPTPGLVLPGSGIFAQTSPLNFALRTLQQPAAGLTITNPGGVAGDPTLALANDLSAVEGLSTNGIATRAASDTWTTRTITGTANEITATNGDGVSGNPTISLPASLTFTGKNITGGMFTTPTINSPVVTGGTFTGSVLKGYPRNIEANTTTVGSVGSGATTLHSFTLVAGSLASDGDYIEIWYGGNYAQNDNNKLITAFFGGTGYEGGGALDLDDAVGWTLEARIIRVSATSVRVSHTFIGNNIFADGADAVDTFNAGGFVVSRNKLITELPNLNTNDVGLAVQGTGVADNDVIQNLSIIKLTQR